MSGEASDVDGVRLLGLVAAHPGLAARAAPVRHGGAFHNGETATLPGAYMITPVQAITSS